MRNEVTFTMSEMRRYGAIQALLEKKMTMTEAASALELSTPQIKRIKKKLIQGVHRVVPFPLSSSRGSSR